MADSKKVVLAADGATATVADAEIADIFTTLFSTSEAVTGMYGIIQKVGLAAAGAAIQKKLDTGSWGMPFVRPG